MERNEEFLRDMQREGLKYIIDPRFARLRDRGPSFMVVREGKWDVDPLGFFAKCWDAWSPERRRCRAMKFMPNPKPVAGLLWRAWRWIRYSKATREKPWTFSIDYSVVEHLRLTKEQFDAEFSGHFERLPLDPGEQEAAG